MDMTVVEINSQPGDCNVSREPNTKHPDRQNTMWQKGADAETVPVSLQMLGRVAFYETAVGLLQTKLYSDPS